MWEVSLLFGNCVKTESWENNSLKQQFYHWTQTSTTSKQKKKGGKEGRKGGKEGGMGKKWSKEGRKEGKTEGRSKQKNPRYALLHHQITLR